MRELLKRNFELSVQMRWLKHINKQTKKYNKLAEKTRRQGCILNALLKAYEEKYGENLRKTKGGGKY